MTFTLAEMGLITTTSSTYNRTTYKWDLPTIINTNIRGALASKIDEIKVIKDNYGVDVLAVTETWCTSRIPDSSLSLPCYHQHGGVVCYVRDTIPTKQWTELNQTEFETMWMTIRPPKMPRNHPQITICTVYHPPGADDWTLLNHIDQSVDYVRRHHPYTGVIIMDDLNKLRDSHLKRHHNLKQRNCDTGQNLYQPNGFISLSSSRSTDWPIGSYGGNMHFINVHEIYRTSRFKDVFAQLQA